MSCFEGVDLTITMGFAFEPPFCEETQGSML
jgi:hypothetical protein